VFSSEIFWSSVTPLSDPMVSSSLLDKLSDSVSVQVNPKRGNGLVLCVKDIANCIEFKTWISHMIRQASGNTRG
jgi:hypothetical protein